MKTRTRTFLKVMAMIVLAAGIVFGGVLFYHHYRQILTSPEALRDYIRRFGLWAPLVFFVLQAMQVIVSPIPGNVTGLAGGALFGIWPGFFLNSLGVLAGSIVAFLLAKAFGRPLVVKLIGGNVAQKYDKAFAGRSTPVLLAIFLIPFFPDDALCFLAGLSAVPLPLFILLVLVGRTPGMFVASLTGAGVLRLSVIHWAAIAAVSLVLVFLAYKFRRRIEDFFYRRLKIGNGAEGKQKKPGNE